MPQCKSQKGYDRNICFNRGALHVHGFGLGSFGLGLGWVWLGCLARGACVCVAWALKDFKHFHFAAV